MCAPVPPEWSSIRDAVDTNPGVGNEPFCRKRHTAETRSTPAGRRTPTDRPGATQNTRSTGTLRTRKTSAIGPYAAFRPCPPAPVHASSAPHLPHPNVHTDPNRPPPSPPVDSAGPHGRPTRASAAAPHAAPAPRRLKAKARTSPPLLLRAQWPASGTCPPPRPRLEGASLSSPPLLEGLEEVGELLGFSCVSWR